MMKGHKNWSNAMTSASTTVETMSKSSVRYVHKMAIYMVCNTGLLKMSVRVLTTCHTQYT